MISYCHRIFNQSEDGQFFLVFHQYLGNGKEFLDEFFCIAFRKISEFFTIEFLPIRPLL